MVQTSKLLALIGAILSILGAFFFSLYTYVFPVYGVGGLLSIGSAFGAASTGVHYILIITFFIFLLATIVQIFGIQSHIIAMIGGGITLVFCIFIFLGVFGVLPAITDGIGFLLDNNDWIPGVIPVNVNLFNVGLGTYITTVGGVLSFVSGFLPRE